MKSKPESAKIKKIGERLAKTRVSGVKTDNFCTGRILADFLNIWWVFLEILPFQNSRKKTGKNRENLRKTKEKLRKTYFSLVFLCLEP